MFSKTLLASAIALIGLGASQAHAQYDETRIRQSDQQTRVTAPSWGYFFFTASGHRGDRVVAPFINATIEEIRLNPARYGVYEVVLHSGGQYSVRFCIRANAAWNQGLVCIFRGSTLIDADRIVVY